MLTLSDIGMRDLVWRYPETEDGAFELSADEARLGWLRFDERAGAPSVAELAGQTWSFQHVGGALPHVKICKGNSPDAVAEFAPRLTGGGVVSFASGSSYCWNRAKIWSPTWCFRRQGEGQGSSVCVSQQAGPLRDGGRVKICGKAAGLPEAPVLVLLAWYLRVLAFEMLADSVPGTG